MWATLFSSRLARKRLQEKAQGPLRDYYAIPYADSRSHIKDIEFVSLDFETTGLDPSADHILSIGLVHICGLSIRLSTVWHQIVYTARELPEATTIIHQITDDAVEQGRHVSLVLPTLLERIRGKVLLVHHQSIESGFLNALCSALYQAPFEIPLVDTEQLAQRQFERKQVPLKSGQLRLYNLRKYYQLPAYKAHNALSDAIATAELFLALVYEICPNLDCRLKDVLYRQDFPGRKQY